MVELRDAFLEGLHLRRSEGRRQTCTLMVAVTLMQGVNDSPRDAEALARLLAPISEAGFKVSVDLIPYNDHTGNTAAAAPTAVTAAAAEAATAPMEGADSARVGMGSRDEYALATPLDPLLQPGALPAFLRIARPDDARVANFHATVRAAGLACYVRVTRGDDQSAACGQLATTTTAAAAGVAP
jgi:hypothetical protein